MRITFPTIAQNTSPTCVLASFLEILGRKIDMAEDLLDS